MRCLILIVIAFLFFLPQSFAQADSAAAKTNSKSSGGLNGIQKELPAKRLTGTIQVDGLLEEEIWKTTTPATGFVEFRPNPNAPEKHETRTEVYIVYDNTAIYVAGYCHERTRDSVSKELIGRDLVGVNDFVGVIFDTYNDKINGVGFYVTPYGEQYDAKYSSTGGEDDSWSAVWDSDAKVVNDGWTFEMRIPYSALRFTTRENQTWGLNITRRRNKTAQQYMWNPLDINKNGFINQGGLWTGIEKIQAPLRLSLSPYISAYVNHDKSVEKPLSSSVNGGMDVKYGINESFTLDMTLVPDFGQVRSDNQVLNLSAFEVKYSENRPFFTEGTELFNKGNLFYSRRIGAQPIHYYDVYGKIDSTEKVVRNPQEAKLLNASKISGRTAKGLGIGVFNAVSQRMFAVVEDSVGNQRKIETSPLTNYNIVVLDQTLKNNSSVSVINTNVMRNGSDPDANVTAALFDFNNKKNIWNANAQFTVSQVSHPINDKVGYFHRLGFGKGGGRFMFNIGQEIADTKYDINDMGYFNTNNYIEHYFWTGYRWNKPKKWYNNISLNYNFYYSNLFSKFEGQKIDDMYQAMNMNINGHIQMKNLWMAGFFTSYSAEGNDFYEPRKTGRSFRTPEKLRFNGWLETNSAKKYSVGGNVNYGRSNLFDGRSYEFNISHNYRFSDKFSMRQRLMYNFYSNDAGYDAPRDAQGKLIYPEIMFARRDRNTIENEVSFKYNFSKRSGFTLRARHYSSQVKGLELYDLQDDGTLRPTIHPEAKAPARNFNIMNIDAVYTLQFAPGSFINIVWKEQSIAGGNEYEKSYFRNFDKTISVPQVNNLSIKVIYFLDYLDLKKLKKQKSS